MSVDGSFSFDTNFICSPDKTRTQSNDQLIIYTIVNMAGMFVLFGICFASVFLHFSHFWTLRPHNKFQTGKTSMVGVMKRFDFKINGYTSVFSVSIGNHKVSSYNVTDISLRCSRSTMEWFTVKSPTKFTA